VPQIAEGELGNLMKLGVPLMGAQLAQMLMGVLDTVMAGRLSAVDLAGIALGGNVLWPVMLMMMGFLQAVTPTVSQLNGARRQEEVGEVIRQALWLALLAAVIICTWIRHAEPFYHLMSVDPAAVKVSVPYLRATSWGIPAIMGYFVFRYLAEGMGYTRPTMLIACGALLLKVPLNFIFMYGLLGAPELGGVGCGVSTAIVMWCELIAILIVVSQRQFRNTGLQDRFSWPIWQHIKPLLIIGAPIGATLFFEVGLFSLTTILLGRFGAEAVASHTIAMNLAGIIFMLPLALGMASTIRIGFNIGAGEPHLARRTTWVAMQSSAAIAVVAATLAILFRYQVAAIYTTDPKVLQLAATLMLFVAAFQLFDATQATALGALRGYKDTRIPMLITMFGYWVVGLPVGCVLGFGWIAKAMGIYGFWIGLVAGLAIVCAALNYRLWLVSKDDRLIQKLSGFKDELQSNDRTG